MTSNEQMIKIIAKAIDKNDKQKVFDFIQKAKKQLKELCHTSGIKSEIIYNEIDRLCEALDSPQRKIRNEAKRKLKTLMRQLITGKVFSRPLTQFQRKFKDFKRKAIATTVAGATLIGGFTFATQVELNGEFFSETFKNDVLSLDNKHPACHDNTIIDNGKYVAAWAVMNYPKNANEQAFYDLVIGSVKENIDINLIAAKIKMETGGLRDTNSKTKERRKNRTADGLLQYVVAEKLTTIRQYGKKINFNSYPAAEKHMAALANLLTKKGAEKKIIRAYLDEKHTPSHETALNAFNSPKLLAQLNAKREIHKSKSFSFENQPTLTRLNKLGLESSVQATRFNYLVHFIGATGGPRLIKAIEKAPNLSIHDDKKLREYGLTSKGLLRSAKENSHLFTKKVANGNYKITLKQLGDTIGKKIDAWTNKAIARTKRGLAKGETIAEICAKNPEALAKIKDAVPQSTTLANVAFVNYFSPNQRKVITENYNASVEWLSATYDSIETYSKAENTDNKLQTVTQETPAEKYVPIPTPNPRKQDIGQLILSNS